MSKLTMCRICFATNTRLCPLSEYLQDMYEKISSITFKREDRRPLVVCYICHARLQNCHRLRMSCLHSDKLLTEILSTGETKQDVLSSNTFSVVSALQMSVGLLQNKTDCLVKEETRGNIFDVQFDEQNTKGNEFIKLEVENITIDEKNCNSKLANTSAHSAELKKIDKNNTKIDTSDLKKPHLPTQKTLETTSSNLYRKKHYIPADIESENIHKINEKITSFDKQTNKNNINLIKYENTKTQLKKSKINIKNRFKCEVCNKLFNHKTSYEIHTRTHTGEKPYMCDVCTKCFIGKNALTIHYRMHTGEKPYTCHICKKTFSTNTALKKHVRIHTGDKPYSCSICKKSFVQKISLDCHIRAHTGEKPFLCKICNNSFKQKSQLDHHIRTHTGDKPFSCDVCQKRFTKRTTLKEHIRMHTGETPYKCDVCKKGFVRKSALTIHIRTHSGEKPYMCHMCNKCFRSRSTLTDHIRTHAGNKPFPCDVCNKCFTKKATLVGHKRLHTGKIS